MTDDRPSPQELVPVDPVDDYLSLARLLSTAIPVFGGAVGHVLSEWAAARRAERLREVLVGVTEDIKALGARARDDYVRSEEFEDLLDQTLRRAASERHEEKRRIFRRFLVEAMTSAGDVYDEQLRILQTIDEIQLGHLKVLRAVMQPADQHTRMSAGSQLQVLQKRIGDMPRERISDLVGQLNDMRVLKMSGLHTMMTGTGAENTRAAVTEYGNRLVRYILEEGATK